MLPFLNVTWWLSSPRSPWCWQRAVWGPRGCCGSWRWCDRPPWPPPWSGGGCRSSWDTPSSRCPPCPTCPCTGPPEWTQTLKMILHHHLNKLWSRMLGPSCLTQLKGAKYTCIWAQHYTQQLAGVSHKALLWTFYILLSGLFKSRTRIRMQCNTWRTFLCSKSKCTQYIPSIIWTLKSVRAAEFQTKKFVK